MKPINIKVYSKYELYLQSEEFDKIRQAVFKRDNYQCIVCGSKEKIQPHHMTYINIYHEELHDLITVCHKCHAAYHAIKNRTDLLNELYISKRQKQNEEYAERQVKQEMQVATLTRFIMDEYLPQDQCNGGPMNMCEWLTLNAIIKKECNKYKVPEYKVEKAALMNWFIFRRCEVLKGFLEKNLSIDDVMKITNLSYTYLSKWYNRSKVEAKLNEERK